MTFAGHKWRKLENHILELYMNEECKNAFDILIFNVKYVTIWHSAWHSNFYIKQIKYWK